MTGFINLTYLFLASVALDLVIVALFSRSIYRRIKINQIIKRRVKAYRLP